MNVPLMLNVMISLTRLSVTLHQIPMYVFNALIILIVNQTNHIVTYLKMFATNASSAKLILEGFAVMKVKSMIMEFAKILVPQLGPSKLQGFVVHVT